MTSDLATESQRGKANSVRWLLINWKPCDTSYEGPLRDSVLLFIKFTACYPVFSSQCTLKVYEFDCQYQMVTNSLLDWWFKSSTLRWEQRIELFLHIKTRIRLESSGFKSHHVICQINQAWTAGAENKVSSWHWINHSNIKLCCCFPFECSNYTRSSNISTISDRLSFYACSF